MRGRPGTGVEGASGSGECSWGRRRWPCPALEDTPHRSGPGSGSICRESRLPSPGAHATLPRPPSRRSPQWSPLCQLTNNSFFLHGESGLMVDNSNHEAGSQWRIMVPDLTAWQPPRHPALELDRRQVAAGGRAGQAPRAAPGGCSEDPGSLCLMAVPQGAPSPVQRGAAWQPSCRQRPQPGRASRHFP